MVYKKGNKIFGAGILLIFALFYFWLANQIPYTHDDWDWGLSNGIYQLLYANLNGRYAGNFFEVIMTRSELVKCVIMGSCYFLIPLGLAYFSSRTEKKNKEEIFFVNFLLCNCLIFTMDRVIMQQTYGWVAGFANFVISMVFFMVWVSEMLKVFDKEIKPAKDTFAKFAGLFAMSVACQLFLENLAVYNIVLSVIIIGVHFCRTRKIPTRNIVMFCGTIAGTVFMFSSSLYKPLFSNGEALSGIRELVINKENSFTENVYSLCYQAVRLVPRIFENNSYICFALLIFLVVLLLCNFTKSNKLVSAICIVSNIGFLVYFISENYVVAERTQEQYFPDFIVSATFFIMVLAEIVFLYKNKPWQMYKLILIWCSVPVVIAPLAVTTEVGSRLFFTSNFFMILFALILASEILKSVSVYVSLAGIGFLLVCSVTLLILHGETYGEIGECKRQREIIISQSVEQGCDTITLPPFPHRGYIWLPDPVNEQRVEFFKEFYGIPQDVEVIFLK